jgi:hypothetical protein
MIKKPRNSKQAGFGFRASDFDFDSGWIGVLARSREAMFLGLTTKSAKDTKVSDIFDFKLHDFRGLRGE